MKREVIQYKVCDMPHTDARGNPREVVATVVSRFARNGYRYEMDLCEECDSRQHAETMAFADHAVLVGEPSVLDRRREHKTIVLTARQKVAPVEAERRRDQAMKRPPLPPAAERWHLNDHALERMAERGLDLYEVLMCCHQPEHVTPLKTPGEATEERLRGDVKCLVDPRFYEVFTVARPSQSKNNPANAQRASV